MDKRKKEESKENGKNEEPRNVENNPSLEEVINLVKEQDGIDSDIMASIVGEEMLNTDPTMVEKRTDFAEQNYDTKVRKLMESYNQEAERINRDMNSLFAPENISKTYTVKEKLLLLVYTNTNKKKKEKYESELYTNKCRERKDLALKSLGKLINTLEMKKEIGDHKYDKLHSAHINAKDKITDDYNEYRVAYNSINKAQEELEKIRNDLLNAQQERNVPLIKDLRNKEHELQKSIDNYTDKERELSRAIVRRVYQIDDMKKDLELARVEKVLSSEILADLKDTKERFRYYFDERYDAIEPGLMLEAINMNKFWKDMSSKLNKINESYTGLISRMTDIETKGPRNIKEYLTKHNQQEEKKKDLYGNRKKTFRMINELMDIYQK